MTRDSFRSVRERAESIGVDQQKVLTWIHTGQLRAIDVSERPGGRPRWRIFDEDWTEFLASRSNQSTLSKTTTQPATKRRRRTADSNIIQFY